MKTSPSKTERLHSLDSLRAIMMLLGLVIHSAITYNVTDWGSAWSLKDPNTTSVVNDYIVDIIHVFRMQIFFLVAGFFGAMLFFERKPIKMMKNRISRIVFPFIVFVFLLWPSIVFSFVYTGSSFSGSLSPLTDTLAVFSSPNILIPNTTFHLWFLYYLAIITFVSVGFGLIFNKVPIVTNFVSNTFSWVIQKPAFRLLIFSSTTVVIYLIMGTSKVETSVSFVLNFNTFLYYFYFYMIGWVLFKSKNHLSKFIKYDWLCTSLGIVLFSVHFLMETTIHFYGHIILKSVMVWLFIFGITGLFIRYGSNHSPMMRYISDSSYWVYLVHLTLTAIIPSIIVDWPIPSTLKFLIVLSVTGVICFVTYHYFVRATFIGNFLNGRRYSKKIKDIRLAEQVNKAA